jgi:aldehyde dehydrogenase (NAD+)
MTAPTPLQVARLLETLEYGPAPESAQRAREWLRSRGERFGHFIGGGWTEPGELFPTFSPSTGARLAELTQGSPEDVDQAVRAAAEAFPGWSSRPGHDRARFLYALGRQIQKHSRLFAVLETLDNGKPIRESRDLDIPLVARHFHHHAGWAQLLGDALPHHRPLGVVGQIIPWNFPLLMLAWKVAPALATGNTVVLKPAEFTSLTSLLFGQLCQAAGLPPGVVNIVTGDGRTGAALVRHPDVAKIAFTGSTEVGRIIREETAGTGKHLSLELGGKSPFLVFDDADLDSVVEGVVDAIWFNQGQVCCAGSRILVHEGTAEALTAKLKARMERLRMGDPLDKAMDMGAIVAPVQLERIRSLVAQGEAEGARIWQPSWNVPEGGSFFPPTLCTDVEPSGTLAQVEIFGPVVVLMTFRTPAEAVEMANDTRYGLAASVWTENVNLALDIAPKVKAGTVWVNCTNLFDAASGFGGYRESGFGREGGIEGLKEYLEPVWEAEDRAREASPRDGAPAQEPPAPLEGLFPSLAEHGATGEPGGTGSIDRTAKLYIGGKQTRPDEGYSLQVVSTRGVALGEVPRGNRKDIRNAVEAARAAQPKWGAATAHLRSQILYYLGENLEARGPLFVERIRAMTGTSEGEAAREVEAAVERCFIFGAWADKWDGRVHATPFRNVTLAMPEPLGVLGIVAPEAYPLLGVVGTLAPAIAMGNAVVVIPWESFPLAATDLYQVLDTSDIPGGVVNIVTGRTAELAPVLAAHDDVDGVWYFGDPREGARVERLAAGNMKHTWVSPGSRRPWLGLRPGEGEEFLERATQVKNIWVPYGE